ncbi:transcriptional regulator [Xanthomonas euvesicatoria]|uniref:transcriptional regulator n=1 Tax=Xanthomonas euvesicatoria TaxID=456327 RepID=UPI001C486B74|nr:transcriptional regulator [Xanthomonas euvesicatoria]MBV6848588.1 transcriptional regulator [Xanthomonas campestris pv. heliotropii]
MMGKKETEEAWLHAQVGPAFDALKADPGRAVTADQVRVRLADIAQAMELVRRVDAGLESLTPFDPAEDLTTAEAVAAFLADAEATADPAYIEHAHQVAARARTTHGIAS